MYTINSRIRYSEVNKDKVLDYFGIINYFQDCSTFNSEDMGMGVGYLESRNRAWLMTSWHIVVNRFPKLFENIEVSTWPYDFSGMCGYRNFIIKDSVGEICALANSIWVLVDTIKNRPVRITEEDFFNYKLEPKLNLEEVKRKINIPNNLTAFKSFDVVKSDIDTNNHVNNGQYVRMAQEILPLGFLPTTMRAEYKKPATLSHIITPYLGEDDESYTVVLSDNNQKPYAIISFDKN